MGKKKKRTGFLKEFKAFIMRGNVLDLAVGIIIGGAFTTIVRSLTNDILMPFVGGLIGGVDFAGLRIPLWNAEIVYDGAIPSLDAYGQVLYSSAIYYGRFLQAIVDFLIVAFVIFILIKSINSIHKVIEEKRKREEALAEAAKPEPVIPENILLLREIRDLLKKQEQL